jgi:inner membrane protein
MTVYNHVAGGIVFTGTFCSLFDINIFGSKTALFVCIIGAILPDIDHTKSLIGKIFYPLSKAIYRNFGHRTITHSLLIFSILSLIFGVFEGFFSPNPHLYLIFIFAYFSHLVLDMITVAGVPLFYPFFKNRCVIPANPKLRLHTGNMRSEGVLLFIFSILTFTFQPLFANGFWSTYNQNFGTISHINREFSRSNQVLELDYVFQYFGEVFAGTGLILESSRYQIRVLNNDNLIVINKDENTQIQSLEFHQKDSIYAVQKHNFVSISPDSLASYFSKNYVL